MLSEFAIKEALKGLVLHEVKCYGDAYYPASFRKLLEQNNIGL
jgi:hypothetical protein